MEYIPQLKDKNWMDELKIKIHCQSENQDGSIDRHTAPPRTTRTDRESNGKEVRH